MRKIKGTILAILIVGMAGLAMAAPQPGAVFATDSTGNPDANLFPGTEIFVAGTHLVAGSSFDWDIYDMDVTCPPETVYPGPVGCAKPLKHGTGGVIAADGTITPPKDSGWAIPNGAYANHPYKLVVTIGPTNQNLHPPPALFYTKVDSFAPVPELATGILVSAGLLGLVLVRRKHKN